MDHDGGAGRDEALHPIRIESGQLAELAGGPSAKVNSSHHQSVGKPGRGLRVAARTPDGVIEALEWTAGPGWVLGVQWHPERMPGDAFRRGALSAAGERGARRDGKSRSRAPGRRVVPARRKSSR